MPKPCQNGGRWAAGLIALLGLLTPVRASSEGWVQDAEFREAVKQVARAIKDKSKASKAEAPTIKYPRVDTDQPTLPGGTELGIETALRRLLEQEEIKLADTAALGLRVTYQLGDEPRRDKPEEIVKVLVLEFVVQSAGQGGGKYLAKIHNTGLILTTRGMPAQLISPGKPQTAGNHQDRLHDVLSKGTGAVLSGVQVLAEKEGPFGLEVQVGSKGLSPRLSESGQAYVELQKGQTFTIVLHNRSEHEAVAAVTIDGIDVCHFSDEREKEGPNKGKLKFQPLWLVPAGKSATIRGWYRTQETSEEFLVVEEKDSVRSRLGYNGVQVHCITAAFARAWEKGKQPPLDEPTGGKSTDNVGIGVGNRIADHKEWVERVVGKEHSVITVRYRRP